MKVATTLSTITAAIVGMVLNLAVWFSLYALFPNGRTVDWFAAAVSVVAFIGLIKWKWGVIHVVLGAAIAEQIFKCLI